MIRTGVEDRQAGKNSSIPISLGARLIFAGALLLAEVVTMTILVDTGNLHGATGLALLAMRGSISLRILVMATVLSVVLSFLEFREHPKEEIRLQAGNRFSPLALTGNLIALAAFATTSLQLFNPRTLGGSHTFLTLLCIFSGLAMFASAASVFVPLQTWRSMFRLAPLAPVFGLLVTLAVFVLTAAVRPVWAPWMRLTYKVVLAGLHLICGNVVADANHFVLGTTRFSVVIAPECSGYEGMALMLVFGSAWLWFFRREFRFPQALLLLPAGVAAIWVLNCARILTLILIGNAGAPAIAAGGFHSEAGWISFLILSGGLLMISQRIRWILVAPHSPIAEPRPLHEDETAAYLLPFLAILAAGMLAHAATASFEWLYPLRVIAAAAAIWWFRGLYPRMEWKIEWQSVAIGIAVCALWMGAAHIFGGSGRATAMPAELAAASAPVRIGWLWFRIFGAVVTVPLAEELAFRGYILRRLQSANFTAIDFRQFSLMPLAVSSVLFGLMHGRQWIAGTIAGVFYAMTMRRRGSLADAAVAHAVTNALIAIWVLSTGDWSFW